MLMLIPATVIYVATPPFTQCWAELLRLCCRSGTARSAPSAGAQARLRLSGQPP